jgi:rhodanese-related sulfurtransferase
MALREMSVPEISVDELAARLERPTSILIDVREPDEYEDGHVPGARLLPLGDVPEAVGDLAGPGELLVICRSGARSMRACEFLAARGIPATNIAGGTLAWVASGRPVDTGGGDTA